MKSRPGGNLRRTLGSHSEGSMGGGLRAVWGGSERQSENQCRKRLRARHGKHSVPSLASMRSSPRLRQRGLCPWREARGPHGALRVRRASGTIQRERGLKTEDARTPRTREGRW